MGRGAGAYLPVLKNESLDDNGSRLRSFEHQLMGWNDCTNVTTKPTVQCGEILSNSKSYPGRHLNNRGRNISRLITIFIVISHY